MTTKMQQRRGTAAAWTSANTVLAAGELGVETDTHRVKCGDGSTAWNSLSYLTLADGEVTSAKIADGTIVNADINAAAAIDSSKLVFGAAKHLSGTGSPEGVVTAAPGSTWLQTNATTDVKGWIRWIKATGTGNTGWVAGPEADTGWRDISSLLINSWTYVTRPPIMRRIGNEVTITFPYRLNGASSTSNEALPVPAGFRRSPSREGWSFLAGCLMSGTNNGMPGQAGTDLVPVGFSMNIPAGADDHDLVIPSTDIALTGTIRWLTADTWPTSLPGSAA